MDRELPRSVVIQRRRKVALKVAIGLALLVCVFVLVGMLATTSVNLSNITTSTVDVGSVEVSLAAGGKVVPCYEEAVVSPVSSRIVKVFCQPGDTVTKGQRLLEVDAESLQFEYQRLKAEYAQTTNQHQKLKLEIKQRERDAATQREIQKLKIAALKASYEGEKYLLSIGGCARETVDKLKMDLSVAELELDNAEKSLEQRKKGTELEIQSLDLDLSIRKNKLNELARMLERAQLGAPIAGTISFLLNKPGMAIGSGEVVARVANLSKYGIEATVGDNYAEKLQVGQEVVARVGHDEILGRIANISPSVAEGVLGFSVALNNPSFSQLRPNMKVELRIISQRVDSTLRLGIGEYYHGASEYQIFVINGEQAELRTVVLGGCSFSHVQVVSGLKRGEMAITSDMKSFERNKQLKVNK